MEAPAGWYPDPQAEADERYWDGAEWTERTRQEQAVLEQSAATSVESAVRGSTQVGDAAALASMGYLHAIALVVISGVVVTLGAGIGLLLLLVFEVDEFAGVFFIVGGAVGIAMLVASVFALLRADVDRNRARNVS